MKTVEIVDTEDKVTVRINGVLIYNYHSTALKAFRAVYSRNEIIKQIFQQNEVLFDMFLQQLREEGYFDEL